MYCYFSVINDNSVPTYEESLKYFKASCKEVTMTFIDMRQLGASVSSEADNYVFDIQFYHMIYHFLLWI